MLEWVTPSVEDHSWGLPTYQPYPCNIQFICQRTTYLLTNHIFLVSNSHARIHRGYYYIALSVCVSKKNLNHWSDGIFLIESGEEVWEGWRKLLCSSSLWRTKTITHWHRSIVRIMRLLVQNPTRYKNLLFHDCLYTYNHEVIVEQIISPSSPLCH